MSKSSEAAYKWCAAYPPVLTTDILMGGVYANIDKYANDDEHYNRCNLQGSEPVFYICTVSCCQ